ncbi:PDDEXK nuclease domain-containing protein [Pedobacter sp.]|uniref:PDDEXK nuclease domain-containing protein n=1 Tax=Pedobacter sp. TaxID=1411316 RepID=UPI003BA8AB65
MLENQFAHIVALIKDARNTALKNVNSALINLYWNIGEHIHNKVNNAEWGQSVVKQLAEFLSKQEPNLKGFSDKNLWRMKQFYENYKDFPKLSPLVREISWTNNLIILSRTKSIEEQEFYLKICKRENYSSRELERQINTSFFERSISGNIKLSAVLREMHQDIESNFKDSYVFEFLNLPEPHNESDLQKSLILQMKNFILELGKDFLFISEEYKIQVGKSDFYIDLLFYHRGLQCLVAFELKVDKFKPEHLGQLNFYLEALDRDVKKVNENPSIGILLCKDKDNEVVEYALSRSLSPTLVSEYKTQLPDKKLLQQKIHELFK